MAFNFLQVALGKVKQKASDLGKYFDPSSNAGQNFWSTPVARGMATFQQTNPLQTGFDIAKGASGEYAASVNRAGGQNWAPIPSAKYTPRNVAQLVGTKIPPFVTDIVAWQQSGINPTIERGMKFAGATARISPFLGPKIASFEETIAKIPSLLKKKPVASSAIHLPEKGVYAELTPEELTVLKNEVKNIPVTKGDIPHLTPLTKLKGKAKAVSLEEIKELSPNVAKATKGLSIQPKGVGVKMAQIPQKAPKLKLAQEKTIPAPVEKPPTIAGAPGLDGRQAGGVGVSPSAPIISDEDLVSQLSKVIKEAKPLRGLQEKIYTKERGQKLAKMISMGEKVPGEAGLFARKGALKGELTKVDLEPIRQNFTQENVDRIFEMVWKNKSLGEWEKVTAGDAMGKLLNPQGTAVPTKNELELLYRVYGKDFTESILSKRTLFEKLGEYAMQAYNLPRSMMAGVADFSGTLMQNLVFAYRHPVITARNFGLQVKMFANENFYKASMEEIASRPTYELMKKGRVKLTEVSPVMTAREEQFMSSWAEKIPGFGKLVRATGRAWTGFLNRMRADVFDQMVNSYKGVGGDMNSPTFLKSLGEFVNNGTGRGSLGTFESSANILSQGMFSARKLVASVQMVNPVWYIKADPFVRKEALKTMLAFVSGGITITSLAKLAGADVGDDPTSADYGKIKVGNTRFNVWGPYQQIAVLFARLWKGYGTSSTSGRKFTLGEGYKPTTRLDLISRFFESKEHPTLSLILGALRGQNQIGQPFDIYGEALNRFIPMVLADAYDLYKEHGPVGLLGTVPAILGIPTQTYGKQLPNLETTPSGTPTIKLKPVGGLAEDIMAKIRGTPISNVPVTQQQGIVNTIEAQKNREAQIEELKKQGVRGQTPLTNVYIKEDGSVLDLSEVLNMPSTSSYEKALKEKKAYTLADDILNLPVEQQAQAFYSLGISPESATYYNVARQENLIKTAYINDEIGKLDTKNRGDLINYLVSQRKVINGDMVLANGVVDELYERQIISESEKKMLKNLKIVDGKPVTKLTGRGKKTALKKVSLPTPSKMKPIRSMRSLLSQTKKLKIKRYKFRKKL